MEVSVFRCRFSVFLVFLFQFCHPSNSQQPYIGLQQFSCQGNSSITEGYACNGPKSCKSFLLFRSIPPYDNPVAIAYLLGSEAANIALINNVSVLGNITSGKEVIVPVSCSCNGDVYQHYTPYTIKTADTYHDIANSTYQSLTSCQAIKSQNPYNALNLTAGTQLTVPLRCACPSESQAASGVTFLMTYAIAWGDTVSSISEGVSSMDGGYEVTEDSILEANEMSQNSTIYAFTPLLIPLKSESCTVKPGNFFCYCANGYIEDGISGRVCLPEDKGSSMRSATLLGASIGSGFLCLSPGIYWLYRYLMHRKCLKRKQKLFKRNGGLLLEQQISHSNGVETGRIFTTEELQRATDNYNKSRVLGQGGSGTVYKGMLPDGRIVAVKKSRAVDSNRIDQFINEVAILSQINHRNVVKLLGCCLETEVPLLVYEFIPNGTLSHHIHRKQGQDDDQYSSLLSWASRLRIASEVAGALSYMHSAASIPILHRDIKSANILLDEKYNAKVSDFGTSRTVPFGQTHLTTQVQGTFGYLDPEYFQTSQFSEKGDVYSFGVVLVELLTGAWPISFSRAEQDINLVAHFISQLNDDKVFEIIDPQVAREAEREQILAMALLAIRCLRLEGKQRPTMKEVATEIDGLRNNKNCLPINEHPQMKKVPGTQESFFYPAGYLGLGGPDAMELETFSGDVDYSSSMSKFSRRTGSFQGSFPLFCISVPALE